MKIVSIRHIEQYKLFITDEEGVKYHIDLEQFLKLSDNKIIRKYLNVELFKQVYLDNQGVPCWGNNEMDINPETILKYEIPY